jgi:cGMP-dependent protein kinase
MKIEAKKREENESARGRSFLKRISQKFFESETAASGTNAMSSRKNHTYQLRDMRHVGLLGTGSFSYVKLVHHTVSNMAYALKIMNKQMISNYHLVLNCESEVKILNELDHPLVPMLYGTFQDDINIYILTELLPNGDLWNVLYNKKHASREVLTATPLGGLQYEEVLFYTANALSVISYLHEKDIVYRDLKPENLVT